METAAFQTSLVERAFAAAEMACIHIGAELGYYEHLAKGPLTAAGLAKATTTDARYAREWLEQQVVAGILSIDDANAPASRRKYQLPAGHQSVLADPESIDYMVPLASLGVAAQAPITKVIEAFRTGAGVPYADYGHAFVAGQGAQNRPLLMRLLGPDWLPRLPGVHARLMVTPPARVADIGCGVGWSCIGVANAYPHVLVDGFDLDKRSVAEARRNVKEAGLAKRVKIHLRDAADPAGLGQYDLVTAFECLHDLADPVGALRTMRAMCAPGAAVLIMDENTGDSLAKPGPFDRLFYGWSVLHCLPVGRSATPSAATGTVMRTETLQAYAKKAGFQTAEVAPIQNDFFRFYLLSP